MSFNIFEHTILLSLFCGCSCDFFEFFFFLHLNKEKLESYIHQTHSNSETFSARSWDDFRYFVTVRYEFVLILNMTVDKRNGLASSKIDILHG